MTDYQSSDKRLLQRSMAQRYKAARLAPPALESLPDLATELRVPDSEELDKLVKELEVESAVRAERIRLTLEQRAAGPVATPRAIPIPFDENDL